MVQFLGEEIIVPQYQRTITKKDHRHKYDNRKQKTRDLTRGSTLSTSSKQKTESCLHPQSMEGITVHEQSAVAGWGLGRLTVHFKIYYQIRFKLQLNKLCAATHEQNT